ncbi:MAG: DNA-3-methyladenine glycosylase I [Chitinivibrionales bacterium]|nr:DNA-3-methyladenine glycosylase I [Chitinivibrionales bacterium]
MIEAKNRCPWCGSDELYVRYHDQEWGVPVHDEARHFEFLLLEGAQAGLSWLTILRKRENYRQAFDCFDPARIARYTDQKIETLLLDSGIVRNRRKILSAINNANCFLKVATEFGSFDSYLWGFISQKPIINRWNHMANLPCKTPLSDRISTDLRKRGFSFVGSTIIYSHMQAIGMVNDHLVSCFRYRELAC